ncbi:MULTISPECIES: hypothetical protein [unclassified Lactobacillus]|uniref:hypothetical protein n=1 Tax=unclassified Lactobacillus TaxID=2620435 RepID=UPI000EFB3B75|nr:MULTISPECIES: hypothetical protein [unclassified Lactobacillus]RMC41975.1 hypothetical protein F5ESL0237_00540 [Lactobacillus sp. ESL0237]RMC45582.1 hypothetical protein F5ESL0234_00540 [Lactobacillus sp. ESL0234]RMC46969.1 hypothetical protein F5ESL0236_00545 [Lactobacillus sp. ESL0236]RMC51994.1 hypothetical protein F5ESL0225_00545 [Lactobacillus sp. ESL0225]
MKLNKTVIAGLTTLALSPVATALGSGVLTTQVVHADTIAENQVTQKNNNNYDSLYDNLTPEKKYEFQELVSANLYTSSEQHKFLQDKVDQDNQISLRWEVGVIKEAVKYAVKLVGAKLGEKSLADFVDYLTGFEGNIQEGIEKGLIKYLHVNKNVAYWAAKTVVFIFF